MTPQENKALIRRLVEDIANTGEFEQVDAILAPQYKEHIAPLGIPAGPNGFKHMNMLFRNAFPDWRFTIEDMVAEGDRVAIRGTGPGTHQAPFLGIPPAGKSVAMSAVHLFQIENGKVAARWAQADILGLLQQLGVGPLPTVGTNDGRA